jgi:hypothetical protein
MKVFTWYACAITILTLGFSPLTFAEIVYSYDAGGSGSPGGTDVSVDVCIWPPNSDSDSGYGMITVHTTDRAGLSCSTYASAYARAFLVLWSGQSCSAYGVAYGTADCVHCETATCSAGASASDSGYGEEGVEDVDDPPSVSHSGWGVFNADEGGSTLQYAEVSASVAPYGDCASAQANASADVSLN